MSWHKKNRSLTLIFFDIYNFNKHTFANTIGCSIKPICKITSHWHMWCMFIVLNLFQLNPRKPFFLMFLKLLSILTEWQRERQNEWIFGSSVTSLTFSLLLWFCFQSQSLISELTAHKLMFLLSLMQFIMCSNIICKIPQIFVFSVLLKRKLWNNLYSLVLLMQACIYTFLHEKFDFSEAISFCFSKWLNLYFICDIDNIILDLFQTVHLTLGRLHRFKRDICLCVCEPEKW